MAKAYTRGQKLKNKKAKQALPGLAEVPKKQPNGRTRRTDDYMSDRNPQKVVMEARARQMGEPEGKVAHPMLCCDAGRALWNYREGKGDEPGRNEFWETYNDCFKAYRRYMRQKTGLSLSAKTAKIEMMPERFETSADDTPRDDRTDEERHSSAMNAWDTWKGALDSLPMAQSASVYSALHGWSTLVTYSGWPTRQGMAFIEAVKALHGVVEGGA